MIAKIKLFHCTASYFQDENLIDCPGFSHRGQPFKVKVHWYPWEEWRSDVWLFARNRSHAARQLAIVANVRDLDGGKPHPLLVSAAMAQRLSKRDR